MLIGLMGFTKLICFVPLGVGERAQLCWCCSAEYNFNVISQQHPILHTNQTKAHTHTHYINEASQLKQMRFSFLFTVKKKWGKRNLIAISQTHNCITQFLTIPVTRCKVIALQCYQVIWRKNFPLKNHKSVGTPQKTAHVCKIGNYLQSTNTEINCKTSVKFY